MYKINFTKLTKIWKNLKNTIITINKLKLEKDSKIRIIIEGIFHRKEKIIKPTPKWFKDWNKDFENKIENKISKWFKDWNEKIFIPFKEKVKEDVVNIKKDIAAMKNTPTMKKNLVYLKKIIF